MVASSENTTSPPSIRVTDATLTPAMLPWPTNDTLTGKKTPASSPPTENSSDPDLSSALISGMVQSSEWLEEFNAHSPVWEETVGYDPSLHKSDEHADTKSETGWYARQGN